MTIVTRWPVLHRHEITDADRDPDGHVRDDVLRHWVAGACATYLDRCATLPRDRVRQRPGPLPPAARLGQASAVVVTAGATEFRPDSFTLAVRVRGGEVALDVRCAVQLEDGELGQDVRDELIAIEHSARHVN
jgi:hypothetical protein